MSRTQPSAHSLWVGNSVGESDVMGESDIWSRDRPRGVARDREIQEQKHAVHMLKVCGLGSSHSSGLGKLVVNARDLDGGAVMAQGCVSFCG